MSTWLVCVVKFMEGYTHQLSPCCYYSLCNKKAASLYMIFSHTSVWWLRILYIVLGSTSDGKQVKSNKSCFKYSILKLHFYWLVQRKYFKIKSYCWWLAQTNFCMFTAFTSFTLPRSYCKYMCFGTILSLWHFGNPKIQIQINVLDSKSNWVTGKIFREKQAFM